MLRTQNRTVMQTKNTMDSQHGNVCPMCKGTGRVTIKTFGSEYPNLYVTASMQLQDTIKPCPKCNGFNTDNLENTGIPSNMADCDLSKFNFECYSKDLSKLETIVKSFVNNYKEWKNKGKGLYIWSETPGSGKTFLACCVSKSAMLVNNLKIKFITAPDYITKVSDSYKTEKGENSPVMPYMECDLLILDDIGTQTGNEWQKQEIFRLVNTRSQNGLITIYTSNIPIESLNVDERTISRIEQSCLVLQMPEESIRRKKYDKENQTFIERMLST